MPQTHSFQEDLGLKATGPFRYVVDAAAVGIEAEPLERLARAGRLCFLDFEATGLDVASDALIEVGAAAIRPDTGEIEIFNTFVRTEVTLSPFIRRLTGISQEDVAAAPSPAEVARALDPFIDDSPVVAHNARFEQAWLERLLGRRFASHTFLDTLELLALVYPDTRNMKLDTFCREKLDRRERHRALDDALDTLRICTVVFSEAGGGSPAAANARRALRLFRASSGWLERLEALPDPARVSVAAGAARVRPTSASPVAWSLAAIEERLADVALGREVIPGYEVREEQQELLRRVFDCFAGKQGKTVRISEAGTGIGKTLAYLAIAIPFARHSGEQVIIATSSKLLQSQLMEKDIPAAAALLGHPDLRFTSIKGRANYLCRSRLDGFLDRHRQLLPPTDSFPVALLAAFAEGTSHGEVDRIPGVLFSMHPELDRYTRETTSADASECRRQVCERSAGRCPFREARDRVTGADVIVTNHDLLLRWPPDYAPLRHVIIDEVHELAERADGAYAHSAEAIDLSHRLETVLREQAEGDGAAGASADDCRKALELIAEIGTEARRLAGAENPEQTYRDELAVPLDGPGASWTDLINACMKLSVVLDSVGRGLADHSDDAEAGAAGPAEAFLEAAGVINESFPEPNPDLVVRFRGLARQSSTAWRLVATPISPAADFQFEILDRVETLFGTSATVAVDGDTRGGLGSFELEERAGGRLCIEAPIESPFDYERNLEVLFLDDRTDRTDLVRRTTAAISEVAVRLGGRTMALFTSRDRLAAVTEALDPLLSPEGVAIIAPTTGNADPHELVRTFLDSERAVLLGSRAFWQGVDVPGDACQALVIEKLPFDVPSDPLVARRSELIEREGGQSFHAYMLPRMLLRLKQMIGRLIRTPTDRGIVVIVEPRCDRAYFSRLLGALPPKARHERVKLADLGRRIDGFLAERR